MTKYAPVHGHVHCNVAKNQLLHCNCHIFMNRGIFFQAAIPFAVVGSNTLIEVCGKKVRGRLYPWGVVEGKISIV